MAIFRQEKNKEFLQAYEKYADSIYRHCYFRLHQKELAEDITQETFIKTWKYISEGKEVKNIKSFLYKVAINLIIDNSRKKKPQPLDGATEKAINARHNNIEKEFGRHFEAQQIIQAMQPLDEKHRQVIIMRYIDDLYPAEIAEILQETPNIISLRLNKAIKKVRKLLSEKYHEQYN